MLLSDINEQSSSCHRAMCPMCPGVSFFFFFLGNTYLLNMSLVYFQSVFSHWEGEHVVLRLSSASL